MQQNAKVTEVTVIGIQDTEERRELAGVPCEELVSRLGRKENVGASQTTWNIKVYPTTWEVRKGVPGG